VQPRVRLVGATAPAAVAVLRREDLPPGTDQQGIAIRLAQREQGVDRLAHALDVVAGDRDGAGRAQELHLGQEALARQSVEVVVVEHVHQMGDRVERALRGLREPALRARVGQHHPAPPRDVADGPRQPHADALGDVRAHHRVLPRVAVGRGLPSRIEAEE
jgi:hypothetical protein